MSRRLRRLSLSLLLVVAASAWIFALPAGAQRYSISPGKLGSCYPNNEFPTELGNFASQSSGQGTGEAEVEYPDPLDYSPPDREGVAVQWSMKAQVNGNTTGTPFVADSGSMQGALSIVIYNLSTTNPLPTVFNGRCVAEAGLDNGDGDPNGIEVEFEGTVINFPDRIYPDDTPYPKLGQTEPAVASLTVKRNADGTIAFHVSIEVGTTCNEVRPGSNYDELEINVSGTGYGDKRVERASDPISQSAYEPGRAGLPDGYTPDYEPCPGVYL